MKPRLLLVVQLPPPLHGVTAMNQRVVTSTRLATQFEVDVLPLEFSESIDEMRTVSPRKLLRAVTTATQLAWRLVARRPHAVYFTMAPSGLAFYRDTSYSLLMKAFGVPRIVHVHARGLGSHTARAPRFYAWLFRDTFVIHLSRRLENETATLVDARHVAIVPNGIEDVPGTVVRAVRTGPPRIVFLSNMIREKGPLDLVEALHMLRARGIPFEATFAGAAFHDGCIEHFEALVRTYGLAAHVRYVGPVYGDAKLALLREQDICAFPTQFDAFPLVLLEAMQHGLPVVTTDDGATSEIVVDGQTGFVVPRRDIRRLADALETLVRDPQRRTELGAAGRRRYLERYTDCHFEHALVAALSRGIDELVYSSPLSTRRSADTR